MHHARILVSGAGGEATGYTDVNGRFVIELPAGQYEIRAEKGGKEAVATALVQPGPAVTEAAPLRLDILVTVGGWQLGVLETIGVLVAALVLMFTVYAVVKEYLVWRRRKLMREGRWARLRRPSTYEIEEEALLATALIVLFIVLPAFYLILAYLLPGNFLVVSAICIAATVIAARRIYPLVREYLARKRS